MVAHQGHCLIAVLGLPAQALSLHLQEYVDLFKDVHDPSFLGVQDNMSCVLHCNHLPMQELLSALSLTHALINSLNPSHKPPSTTSTILMD